MSITANCRLLESIQAEHKLLVNRAHSMTKYTRLEKVLRDEVNKSTEHWRRINLKQIIFYALTLYRQKEQCLNFLK